MRSWKETRRDGNELIWGSVKGSKTNPSTKTTHETGQLSREASYQNEAISRRDGHLHWLNRTTSHGGFHDPSTTTPQYPLNVQPSNPHPSRDEPQVKASEESRVDGRGGREKTGCSEMVSPIYSTFSSSNDHDPNRVSDLSNARGAMR